MQWKLPKRYEDNLNEGYKNEEDGITTCHHIKFEVLRLYYIQLSSCPKESHGFPQTTQVVETDSKAVLPCNREHIFFVTFHVFFVEYVLRYLV